MSLLKRQLHPKVTHTRREGWVFVTILTFLLGLSLLTTLTIPVFQKVMTAEREDVEADLEELRRGILEYFRDTGTLPDHLGELFKGRVDHLARGLWKGPYASSILTSELRDRWGNEYLYQKDPHIGNDVPYEHQSFIVASCGQNGILDSANPPDEDCEGNIPRWKHWNHYSETHDDIVVVATTEMERHAFRYEAQRRLQRLAEGYVRTGVSVRDLAVYSFNNNSDRQASSLFQHLPQGNTNTIQVNNLSARNPDDRPQISRFYWLDPVEQAVIWLTAEAPSTESVVNSPGGAFVAPSIDAAPEQNGRGIFYSRGLNRGDNHGDYDLADIVDSPCGSSDYGSEPTCPEDDVSTEIMGSEYGLLDVKLVDMGGNDPHNDTRHGCPEGYESRGYWRTDSMGGDAVEYENAATIQFSNLFEDPVNSLFETSLAIAHPALAGFVGGDPKEFMTLCVKHGYGNLFVERVYLAEFHPSDEMLPSPGCEEDPHFRGWWNPMGGDIFSFLYDNWVTAPTPFGGVGPHTVPKVVSDFYDPDRALSFFGLTGSGFSPPYMSLCVKMGPSSLMAKDVVTHGTVAIDGFPAAFLYLGGWWYVLFELITNIPDITGIFDIVPKVSGPGFPTVRSVQGDIPPLGFIPGYPKVINELYAEFINREGFEFKGAWRVKGHVELNRLWDLDDVLAIIGPALPESIRGPLTIIANGIDAALNQVYALINAPLDILPYCPDLDVGGLLKPLDTGPVEDAIDAANAIIDDLLPNVPIPAGLPVPNPLGWKITECKKRSRDSGWKKLDEDNPSFPGLYGDTGRSSKSIGGGMLSLNVMHYNRGKPWSRVNFPAPFTNDDYPGFRDDEEKHFITVPRGASWMRLHFKDLEIGAMMIGTSMLNSIKIKDAEGNVIFNIMNNGNCDSGFIGLPGILCNDPQLEFTTYPLNVVAVGNKQNLADRRLSIELDCLLCFGGGRGYWIDRVDYQCEEGEDANPPFCDEGPGFNILQ